jgi:hypothetical protein
MSPKIWKISEMMFLFSNDIENITHITFINNQKCQISINDNFIYRSLLNSQYGQRLTIWFL